MRRRSGKGDAGLAPISAPYRDVWLSLTPAQRLRRSWRLRSRLKNLRAIHDAKTFPKF